MCTPEQMLIFPPSFHFCLYLRTRERSDTPTQRSTPSSNWMPMYLSPLSKSYFILTICVSRLSHAFIIVPSLPRHARHHPTLHYRASPSLLPAGLPRTELPRLQLPRLRTSSSPARRPLLQSIPATSSLGRLHMLLIDASE